SPAAASTSCSPPREPRPRTCPLRHVNRGAKKSARQMSDARRGGAPPSAPPHTTQECPRLDETPANSSGVRTPHTTPAVFGNFGARRARTVVSRGAPERRSAYRGDEGRCGRTRGAGFVRGSRPVYVRGP